MCVYFFLTFKLSPFMLANGVAALVLPLKLMRSSKCFTSRFLNHLARNVCIFSSDSPPLIYTVERPIKCHVIHIFYPFTSSSSSASSEHLVDPLKSLISAQVTDKLYSVVICAFLRYLKVIAVLFVCYHGLVEYKTSDKWLWESKNSSAVYFT